MAWGVMRIPYLILLLKSIFRWTFSLRARFAKELVLQLHLPFCSGSTIAGTNSSSSPKIYFNSALEVMLLKVKQRERVSWMSYLTSEEG